MRTQSVDTSPEAERVLIELIRKASIAKRFELVCSWTKSVLQLNQQGILEQHPNASAQELTRLLLAEHYGQMLADAAQKKLTTVSKLPVPDLLITLASLAEIFEQLKISYYIGGSIASSTHGMRQAARDIDIVADIKPEHTSSLIALLQTEYYSDEKAIYEAVQKHTCFSIIHLNTLFKVDVIIPMRDDFNKQEFKRAHYCSVEKDNHTFCLSSPEDIILFKLKQYKLNGESADDQWNDILGVLKVQASSLDLAYLEKWATTFNIKDLLKSASIDAGLAE